MLLGVSVGENFLCTLKFVFMRGFRMSLGDAPSLKDCHASFVPSENKGFDQIIDNSINIYSTEYV